MPDEFTVARRRRELGRIVALIRREALELSYLDPELDELEAIGVAFFMIPEAERERFRGLLE